MGQKVHPFGFRLGFNKTWRSRWYSDRDYAKLLHEDLALRASLKKRFAHAGVAMNPVDHPLGGGEGKSSGGRHPVTPWGLPTKGYKTRNRKATDKFIVQRRQK